MLSTLLGNEALQKNLATALAKGVLPHAVLLAAPDGCGRNYAARCLAADYLYPAGGPGAKAVMRGESPELLLVEGEGKSGQIPVARVRAVREAIFHSSLSAAGRVVLVRDAHRMAAPAANALLKVLEEPPEGALFVLTAPDASALPATVVSRAALMPLAPLPLALCTETLSQHLPAGAEGTLPALLAAVYGGRLGLGLKALHSPERLAGLQNALRIVAALAQPDRYAALCLLSHYEGRADEDRPQRELLLRDMCCALQAALHGASAPGLPAVPNRRAAGLLPAVMDAETALAANAAPKLAFTAMVIRATGATA